jgi:nucleoside-diphosphate-sugar epimerase
MDNLVIGNTSQLSHYFPDKYIKISSRNVDFEYHKKQKYDRIYLCFAEQRTFIEDDEKMFMDINFDYTIKVIEELKNSCNKIIFYSTCELWNNCNGEVTIDTDYNYNYSPYIKSKEEISKYIRRNYDNVIILYPFNFNSPHRKPGFLFSKILDSLISNNKIEIGNTYFYRDIIHPKYVVERSLLCDFDELVGSGRLTHINDFTRKLYSEMGMNYDDYVTENFDHNLKVKRKTFWQETNICLYEKLIEDTVNELKEIKNTIS